MIRPTSHILPFCNQCSAVKADGAWLKGDGNAVKTTQKLSACARCHIARYCNQTCQIGHWPAHKGSCTPQEAITAQEVDTIVSSVCKARSGRVVLTLDAAKRVVSAADFPGSEGTLVVDVTIEGKSIGRYTYLVCSPGFDWKSALEKILNPPNGIHNPGAQVELGHEMIKKGLYTEAFQMMAERTPPHYKKVLWDMFFRQAVLLMHSQKTDIELIVRCAQLLQKNRSEVMVLIQPPSKVELSKELQMKIDEATKLGYGARDVKMVDLAQEVMELGLYDQAFDLVFNWVAIQAPLVIFFRRAAGVMIPKGVAYEKIVQLGKSIGLTEAHIVGEVVGIYAKNNQVSFAIRLARQSSKTDFHLEIVHAALLNVGKYEEAKEILELVSPAKRRDLEVYGQSRN